MNGMGAGPGAPGQTRNVAAGGYPSQQGGGKGGPALGTGQGQQTMGAAASQGAGQGGRVDANRQIAQGIGQMRQQADAQAFYDAARANPNADWEAAKQHDAAVKAHGEGAVTDFYNALMQQGQQGKAPMPAQGRNPNKGQPAVRRGRR